MHLQMRPAVSHVDGWILRFFSLLEEFFLLYFSKIDSVWGLSFFIFPTILSHLSQVHMNLISDNW